MTKEFTTEHQFLTEDARHVELEEDSVDLVITSPPYPMIQMWDQMYDELTGTVDNFLESGDYDMAFRAMHNVLNDVWSWIKYFVKPGGIICINIGDATRKTNTGFKMFSNRAQIIDTFTNDRTPAQSYNFNMLPEIIWRKPANSLNKFMGSGMLPTNAYVTHEHEFILIFRNGTTRDFEPHSDNRYESAYFWEERNTWFSDTWTDIRGTSQNLVNSDARDRSGAFPVDIPYRLINMYSVYDDTVLDPFAGVGTTSIASMMSARNSICIDIEESFRDIFLKQAKEVPVLTKNKIKSRLLVHNDFVRESDVNNYVNDYYNIPVKTKQEKNIRFYNTAVNINNDQVKAKHTPFDKTVGQLSY